MTAYSLDGNFSFQEKGNSTASHSASNESLVEVSFKCLAYALIVIFSIMGNSLVITAFKLNTNGKLRTVNNMFIVSMAAGDLLLTLGSMPERITRVLSNDRWLIEGNLGIFLCKLANFVEKLCMIVAILHLSMIAVDRFLVVFYPYRKIVTKKKALWFIVIAWLLSALFCGPLFYYANLKKKKGQISCKTRSFFPNWKVWYLIFLIVLGTTLVFVVSLYISIAIHVRRNKRPGCCMSVEAMKNVHLRSRILKMVLAIVLAFYCCFLPYWTGWIFCVYSSIEVICDDTYLFISIFLIYANSAINPIIYSFFNENFRVAFHVILLKLCRCKRAYQEQVCPPTTSPGENTVPRKLTQSSSNILLEIEGKVDCTRV